jgi:hypothetical protein
MQAMLTQPSPEFAATFFDFLTYLCKQKKAHERSWPRVIASLQQTAIKLVATKPKPSKRTRKKS